MAETLQYQVETIRQDFPILNEPLTNGQKLVYLDNAATAQKPRCVIEKETECYSRYFANAHRGAHQLGEKITEEIEATRETVRAFIHAKECEEIIFTSGTTMSINMVANGWAKKFLSVGDEILLNVMEHHANIVPWQMAAKATGATVRYLPLTNEGLLDLTCLDDFLTEKTKIVSVTGMSNVLGTVNPVEKIVQRAKAVGAKVLVDAAQSIAHQAVDVQALDVDFLAFSAHKVYGPSGIGVLYGKREILEETEPFLFGGGMIAEVHQEHSTWIELPAKLEGGTPPLAQIVALKPAIDYVKSIGFDVIHTHETELLNEATTQLTKIPGLTILGPDTSHKGAVISLVMEGAHPQDLAALLDRQGVAVRSGHHCAMLLHKHFNINSSLRISFALYNNGEEIDQLISALHFARKRLRLE
ncbi:Cysteine desulfurase =_ SufS [hydrothermal vent metagenome]|uniref:cysteine desulfurase n=1 Tax=hydrothermal vent metagenome TaxID=652676 RepID=A0A3B1D6L8_9ZZZZ